MKREYSLEQIVREPRSVVTVGTFDGVHLGHQAVVRYLLERARLRGGPSVAVSFDPHPREVVHGEAVPLLTTVEERAERFEALGLDRFIVIPFTRDFARLRGEAFVEQVLVDRIGLQEIVIGYDHAFGRGREGDARLLERMGETFGFAVDVIPAQVVEQHVVSSTEIRHLLVDEGEVEQASQLLGRYYGLNGTVERGDGRGHRIGFPTANLAVSHPRKVIPKTGVYAVRVRIASQGIWHGGMMNIGVRPTFDGREARVEVHLLDFEGNLYGRDLRVEFVGRLRDERRFEGVEALREQLMQDRRRCIEMLEGVS